MKLFRTKSIDVVNVSIFGVVLPSVLVLRKARGPRLFTHNCNVAWRKYFRIILAEKPEHSKPNPSLTLMLTLLLTLTLYP